jgi:CCR4-NOT transcription complex subunit 7/8
MPPQIRGFGGGTAVTGPYHQPGFPGSHGQPQGGHLGANQYLNANVQMSAFSPGAANGNAFGAPGLNGGGFADSAFAGQGARMSFAQGPGVAAALQQQQHGQAHHNVLLDHSTMRTQPNKGRIREVWKHNLHEEMAVLRDLVEKYPYIAMVRLSGSLFPTR